MKIPILNFHLPINFQFSFANKLKILLLPVLVALPIYMSAPTAHAIWNPFQTACKSPSTNSNNNVCNTTDPNQNNGTYNNNPVSGPTGAIHEAANVFALVTVVGGLIVSGYSAFVFVTAGGARAGDNSSRARNARTTLTSALTGVAIASLAWVIVTYVTTHVIH